MITLNLLDIIVIGITMVSAIIGMLRGMVKESITLLTWVAATIVAVKYGLVIGNIFGSISTELIRHLIGGFLLFIGVLIIGAVFNILISKIVKVSGFIVIDKILGTVFGVLRSVLVALIVIPLVADLCVNEQWWKNSSLVPKLQGLAEYVKVRVPQDWLQSYSEMVSKLAISEKNATVETPKPSVEEAK